jgi:hypothetical protein
MSVQRGGSMADEAIERVYVRYMPSCLANVKWQNTLDCLWGLRTKENPGQQPGLIEDGGLKIED